MNKEDVGSYTKILETVVATDYVTTGFKALCLCFVTPKITSVIKSR